MTETPLASLHPIPQKLAHRRVTLIVGLAFASNGLALGAMSFALAGLREDWRLDPAAAALLLLVSSVGQSLGAILIGGLADRFGRRPLLATTAGLVALGLALGSVAPGLGALAGCFFLAGLGFGGVAPVGSSLLSEFAPPSARGRLMAWTQVLWVSGYCGSALAGALLLPTLGWRPVLGLGLLNALFALLAPRLVPESPRYLLAHGRAPDAEALARRYGIPLAAAPATRRPPHASLAELFAPAFRRRTAVLWTTWFVMIAAYNGPVVLFPALLGGMGQGIEPAARSALLVALAQFPAVLAAAAVGDQVGRRPLLVAALGVAGAGAALVGIASSGPLLVVGGGALAAGLLAAWPPILAYAAELYPTRMRATAAGWAGAVARLGAVLSPLAASTLLGAWGGSLGALFGLYALLLVGAALVVFIWGEETVGRTLEELSR